MLGLALSLAVTICNESTGFVHVMSLQSALAWESRLRFNTNLRLLSASHANPWANLKGTLFNELLAILLIMSYVSSSVDLLVTG
jgi:hypothetical protein